MTVSISTDIRRIARYDMTASIFGLTGLMCLLARRGQDLGVPSVAWLWVLPWPACLPAAATPVALLDTELSSQKSGSAQIRP